jgi:ubiquinone/menaquinone biosynthesis C-methylase UbiE
MSMTQESSHYFQQVAGDWDSLRSRYFGVALRDAAIARAYLRPEMVVADVGAGTGFLAAGLAPLVRRVYVVDGSPAMLEVARQNLAGSDNVDYHEADGLSLPFPDESLDVVFANMYLHHLTDPLAGIREMARVLVPGGRLVFADMDAHPYAWLKEEMADAWQGFEREQVRGWLAEAGLVNRIVAGAGCDCCAESANPALVDERQREAKISVFVATGTRRMAMREAVRDNYAAIAEAGSSCGCSTDAEGSCCGSGSPGEDCCGGAAAESGPPAGSYSPVELSDAPQEAAEFSLGCGNPIALAGLKPGEVALDIGSGGGLDSFLAAARVGPAGRVIGVDMTPAMLERARATAERNGIHNVEFRQGYAEALPVEEGSVDVIFSNCVINLSEDKGQVFQEAFRALKPGGRLEVSDIVTAGAMPLELRANAAGWAECVTGALPEAEYLELIAQAGFTDVTTRRRTSAGQAGGVAVYSAIVAARKPGPGSEAAPETANLSAGARAGGKLAASSCGCGGSGCCG